MHRDVENHAAAAKGTVGGTPAPPRPTPLVDLYGGAVEEGRMRNPITCAEAVAGELVRIIKGYIDGEAWLIGCCTGIEGTNPHRRNSFMAELDISQPAQTIHLAKTKQKHTATQ